MTFRVITLVFLLAFTSLSVSAGEAIVSYPYELAAKELDTKVDFEPRSGLKKYKYLSGKPKFGCASFGEHFEGQRIRSSRVSGWPHDHLNNRASSPLTLKAALYPENLALDMHDDLLESVVIHGVGPAGLRRTGHGEGAISLRFDRPQDMFGFKYTAGTSERQKRFGRLQLHFFDLDGRSIASRSVKLKPQGDMAFKIEPGTPPFWGVSISNSDPGGVGFDDFVMRCEIIPIG